MASPPVREEWSSRRSEPGVPSAAIIGTWKMLMSYVSSSSVELPILFQEEHILGKELVRSGGTCSTALELSSI